MSVKVLNLEQTEYDFLKKTHPYLHKDGKNAEINYNKKIMRTYLSLFRRMICLLFQDLG